MRGRATTAHWQAFGFHVTALPSMQALAWLAIVSVVAVLGGLNGAHGQQPPSGNWLKLGELPVGGGLETETIRVGREPGGRSRFERLRLTANGGDVLVHEVRVYFVDGRMQRLLQQERIGRHSDGAVAALEAAAPEIDQIEITFKGRGAAGRRPLLSIWVEPARSREEAPTVTAGEWQLLGKEAVPPSVANVVIPVGRKAGRFEAIQVVVSSSDVAFHDIRVTYLDGEVDTLAVRRLIRAGDSSPPLPLKGDARFIREIELVQEADPNASQPAEVQVLARRAILLN